MDLVAEKKDSDSENHNSYARALIDSTSDTNTNTNTKEAADDETQARELRAGLHPLKVFSFLFFDPINSGGMNSVDLILFMFLLLE